LEGNQLSALSGSQICIELTYHNRSLWYLRLGNNQNIDARNRMLIGAVLRQNRQAWVAARVTQPRPASRSYLTSPETSSKVEEVSEEQESARSVYSATDAPPSLHTNTPVMRNLKQPIATLPEPEENAGLPAVLIQQAEKMATPVSTVPRICALFSSPLIANGLADDVVALMPLDYGKEREIICSAVHASTRGIVLDSMFATSGGCC
jgi:hypothetical protein